MNVLITDLWSFSACWIFKHVQVLIILEGNYASLLAEWYGLAKRRRTCLFPTALKRLGIDLRMLNCLGVHFVVPL